MNEKEIIAETDNELESWPGVAAEWDITRKHNVLTVRYGGQSRQIVTSKSPSDRRCLQNHIGQVRKELRSLGAARIAQRKRAGPRPERNKPVRTIKAEKAPVQPNPFEALAGMKVSPARKPSLWARFKGLFQ